MTYGVAEHWVNHKINFFNVNYYREISQVKMLTRVTKKR
jgi:hypothetical protein